MPVRYRADHVGSLLRPQELLDARCGVTVDHETLREIEDRHIRRVLARQKAIGFDIFTDGELRRWGFMSDFNDAVDGLAADDTISRSWNHSIGDRSPAPRARRTGVVVSSLKQTRRLTKHEVDFLRQHSPGDIKMTVPSPNQFPAIAYKKGRSDRAYGTYSDFLWDIAPIIGSEIQALAREGVSYVQIDAPRYSYYVDSKWRRFVTQEFGVDPDDALDEAIRVDNACLKDVARTGVTLAIHLCRGNNRSQWYAEGGYDPIAEKLFNELDVDTFVLEYDTERAGTFEPLRFVPPEKGVVLGLVSSKSPALEPQESLLRLIENASRFVPLDNLALSPQCGFASSFEGNLLTEDEQWRKLQLVVDTARLVWNR
jgi:5-methyltetrahydropteroyltriglutamate--homocysteine methyltransferase